MREFFEALYPNFNLNKNVVEIRPYNIYENQPENRRFCKTIEELVEHAVSINKADRYHSFFECPELKPGSVNGTDAAVLRYPFLFSDLDPYKKDENRNIIETYTKAQLKERLDQFIIRPSIVVDSGSGLHAYWLLDVPLYDKDTVKYILGVLQNRLQGDSRAKLPTQLLRIPGTNNLKGKSNGQSAQEVKVIDASLKRYTKADFFTLLNITEQDITSANSMEKKEKAAKRKSAAQIYNGISFDFNRKPAPMNIKIDNFPELLTVLKKQNMLLISNMPGHPVGKPFKCCFHADDNPSANIFVGKDGYYYYKCFGCGRDYDLISLYQNIKKTTFPQTLLALCEFYGIDFKYQDWIIKQWEKYYQNANLLVNIDDYKTLYPHAFKLLASRVKYLHVLNNYALGHLSSNKYSYRGESLFFFSYDYFANTFGKEFRLTLTSSVRYVNLFCTLGIMKKVPITEVPGEIAHIALKNKSEANKMEPVNFYILNNFHDALQIAEERALAIIKNGYKVSTTMNKDFLILALGQAIADEIYPDDRQLNSSNATIAERLETTLKDLIRKQGYATKQQIVAKSKLSGRLKANKAKKEAELDKYMHQMLQKHNLEYVRANNQLRDIFDLKKMGYIIIPKGIK